MTAPRAPANRAEVVEVMARAADPILFADRVEGAQFSQAVRMRRAVARGNARAILAALEAAGVLLVPAGYVETAERLALALDGIGRLGTGSWMRVKEHVSDASHMEARDALGRIVTTAANAGSLAASPYAPEGGR